MKKPIKKKRSATEIRADILAALEKAFPFGEVERVYTSQEEESYLVDFYPKVHRELGRIKGANILFEQHPDGNREWAEDPDTGHDHLVVDDFTYSYHVLFLSPSGEDFRVEFEEESIELETRETVKFEGRIGCAVAVSEIAPFAVICLCSIAYGEDGSKQLPSIEIQTEVSKPLDLDQYYRDDLGGKAFKKLSGLRNNIAKVLEKLGVAILPEEEGRKIVPWLKPGEEAFLPDKVSVRDALFFTGP